MASPPLEEIALMRWQCWMDDLALEAERRGLPQPPSTMARYRQAGPWFDAWKDGLSAAQALDQAYGTANDLPQA